MGRSLRLIGFALCMIVPAACGGSHGQSPVVPQAPSVGTPALDGVPEGAVSGMAVYVHLPLRNASELASLVQAQGDRTSPQYRHFLTPAEFQARYGPSGADLASAVSALRALGFQTFTTTQGVVAVGPQATVEGAFGVRYRTSIQSAMIKGTGAARTATLATGDAVVPAALRTLGAKVVVPRRGFHVDSQIAGTLTDNRYSAYGPYWFTDLKQAYEYPSYKKLDGSGSTIAIVIDGDVLDSDTSAYFTHEQLSPPSVKRREVKGGTPFDPDPSSDSVEASLDVQQALGSAPGAKLIIYSIPDLTDASILLGYQKIVEKNDVDIVSSSFGGCELYYTAPYNGGTDYTSILTESYHDIFLQGVAQGITWVASSGDTGAYGCYDTSGVTPILGVQAPADDPTVVAVGGTNLQTKSNGTSRNSAYVSENADADTLSASPYLPWASGGGISTIFSQGWYQTLVNTRSPWRTVPDVAMQMGGCPAGAVQPCSPDRSAVATAFNGAFYTLIGTSASAPEFAGLLAVTEENLGGRLGNANYYIYGLSALEGSSAYHSGFHGNNGYPTHAGYDYVTGVGTPHAAAFAQYGGPLAGVPWSPSNP